MSKIPHEELSFSFVASSGPGGQNVNKLATKAVMRWAIARSEAVPDDVAERFCQRYAKRVTREGELVLTSDRHRSRERNISDCIEKLEAMLDEVWEPPRPRKQTRPPASAGQRRLHDKRHRSELKRLRGPPSEQD